LQEDGHNYNNDSVTVRVAFGGVAVLLSGDAEKSAETRLAARWGENLRANVLKAGHHGSNTSSTERFLDLVAPQYVVISCGIGNDYGHPHPAVLQRCRDRGIKLFRTDIDGTVRFQSDGKTIWRVEHGLQAAA
jgi:competence protein ComEC